MDDIKEKKQNFAGNYQGVANDRKNKIEELKQENKLDEESEYYARIFLEL